MAAATLKQDPDRGHRGPSQAETRGGCVGRRPSVRASPNQPDHTEEPGKGRFIRGNNVNDTLGQKNVEEQIAV